jgi:hypothetical protein
MPNFSLWESKSNGMEMAEDCCLVETDVRVVGFQSMWNARKPSSKFSMTLYVGFLSYTGFHSVLCIILYCILMDNSNSNLHHSIRKLLCWTILIFTRHERHFTSVTQHMKCHCMTTLRWCITNIHVVIRPVVCDSCCAQSVFLVLGFCCIPFTSGSSTEIYGCYGLSMVSGMHSVKWKPALWWNLEHKNCKLYMLSLIS